MDSRDVSRIYNYVRGRQLEGTYPGDKTTGVWPVTSLRIHKGWGAPSEEEWPYPKRDDAWPPSEPLGIDLDAAAKHNRILDYQRVRDLEDFRRALASDLPVMAAFEITNQWFTAPGGKVEMPAPGNPVTGSHTVALVGYDDPNLLLIFRNSWGTKWGQDGYGFISYDYFINYCFDAWVTGRIAEPRPTPPGPTVTCRNWGLPDYRGDIIHGIEEFDYESNEIRCWVFCVERDGFLDLEELFVRPNYRGNGRGRMLVEEIKELALARNLPIRAWIPHGDGEGESLGIAARLFSRLNLSIGRSDVRWARYKAVQNPGQEAPPETPNSPARPQQWNIPEGD